MDTEEMKGLKAEPSDSYQGSIAGGSALCTGMETEGSEEAKETEEVGDVKAGEMPAEGQPAGGKSKKYILAGLMITAVLAAGIGAYFFVQALLPRGYQDYTVRKEQYYVEYSDQYDYWDVLTVEYPRLEGIGGEQEEQINRLMYDTAMNRINYWHLEPDEEMRRLQEEYQIFSSDVRCDVAYHSQYLLSVEYREIYAPVSPVYYANITERALNVDMMTGETYGLSDVFTIDEDFIDLWCRAADETFYSTLLTEEELEPFRTESEFWNKYAKSRSAGEVLECEELTENIWLGEDAGVWGFWEERQGLFQ